MLRYFFKYKKHIIALAILIIIEPSLNSYLNLWLANIFDTAVLGSTVTIIIRMLLIGFSVWLFKRLIVFVLDVIKNNFMCNIRLDIKNDLFKNALYKQSYDISRLGGSGEYTSIFINDINILEQRYYSKIVDLAVCISSIVINGLAFFYLNVKLALPIMIFGGIVSVIPWFASKQLNRSNYKYSENLSKLTQRLKEFFSAYPAIKNYAIEKGILENFQSVNYDTEKSKFDSEYELNLANCIGSTLSWFTQIVAIGLGLIMIIKGEVLIGTVIAARSFASDIAEPLQGIISNLNSVRSVKMILKKMDDMTSPKSGNKELNSEPISDKPDLEYRSVSLEIQNNKILDDFSFNFENGKKYLIIGKNGSGKSTLFKLLKKKHEEYEGEILLGGKEIRKMSSEEIASLSSYLTESVVLMSGDINSNVKFFRDVSDDVLKEAIEKARINLNTSRQLLDLGSNISSGEQRRIEIARSMCNCSSIMIFDEVISTLDVKTAFDIENMILNYDKTVIVISHNFSGKLIKRYDEILVMNDGKLIAHGNYDHLLKTCDEFKEICEIKFGVES